MISCMCICIFFQVVSNAVWMHWQRVSMWNKGPAYQVFVFVLVLVFSSLKWCTPHHWWVTNAFRLVTVIRAHHVMYLYLYLYFQVVKWCSLNSECIPVIRAHLATSNMAMMILAGTCIFICICISFFPGRKWCSLSSECIGEKLPPVIRAHLATSNWRNVQMPLVQKHYTTDAELPNGKIVLIEQFLSLYHA